MRKRTYEFETIDDIAIYFLESYISSISLLIFATSRKYIHDNYAIVVAESSPTRKTCVVVVNDKSMHHNRLDGTSIVEI